MESKEPLSVVDNMAEPAFAVDEKHRLVAWNAGSEKLLGYGAGAVLGKSCYQIICGTDVFANRFCDANCPVLNMTRQGERVNSFELNLRTAAAKTVRTNIAIVVLRHTSSKFAIIHRLTPLEPAKKQQIPIQG
jgi:PAS domain-containing protein